MMKMLKTLQCVCMLFYAGGLFDGDNFIDCKVTFFHRCLANRADATHCDRDTFNKVNKLAGFEPDM